MYEFNKSSGNQNKTQDRIACAQLTASIKFILVDKFI